jgi:hypothetical protein
MAKLNRFALVWIVVVKAIIAMMPLSTNQTKHVGAAVVFPYALGKSVLTFNGSCDVAINGLAGFIAINPAPMIHCNV